MYERIFYRLLVLGVIAAVLAVVPVLCLAQQGRSQGCLFTAPGVGLEAGSNSTTTVHFGVGGEGLVYKGLTAGGEIGYVAPWRSMSGGIGILSANPGYVFNRDKKFQPFVTGGYSMGFSAGVHSMINFGAGFNYWMGNRHGLRIEFRDHMDPRQTDYHLMGVRVAWVFR